MISKANLARASPTYLQQFPLSRQLRCPVDFHGKKHPGHPFSVDSKGGSPPSSGKKEATGQIGPNGQMVPQPPRHARDGSVPQECVKVLARKRIGSKSFSADWKNFRQTWSICCPERLRPATGKDSRSFIMSFIREVRSKPEPPCQASYQENTKDGPAIRLGLGEQNLTGGLNQAHLPQPRAKDLETKVLGSCLNTRLQGETAE